MAISKSEEIHRRAIIVDGHCDTPYRLLRRNVHLDEHDTEAQADLRTLREGGITASFFAAYVPPYYANRGAAKFAYRLIDLIHSETARYPNQLTFAADTEGIRRAKQNGKIAIMIGVEGGHAIEDSLDTLRDFYRLGARYMTLTHVNTNNWCDSSGDAAQHDGRHRNDRRHFARLRCRLLRRDRDNANTGRRDTLILPSALSSSAKHDGRHAPRAGEERRRLHDQLLLGIRERRGGGGRHARAEEAAQGRNRRWNRGVAGRHDRLGRIPEVVQDPGLPDREARGCRQSLHARGRSRGHRSRRRRQRFRRRSGAAGGSRDRGRPAANHRAAPRARTLGERRREDPRRQFHARVRRDRESPCKIA